MKRSELKAGEFYLKSTARGSHLSDTYYSRPVRVLSTDGFCRRSWGYYTRRDTPKEVIILDGEQFTVPSYIIHHLAKPEPGDGVLVQQYREGKDGTLIPTQSIEVVRLMDIRGPWAELSVEMARVEAEREAARQKAIAERNRRLEVFLKVQAELKGYGVQAEAGLRGDFLTMDEVNAAKLLDYLSKVRIP